MTDLDTKAIRERAEKQVREYARLAQLRVERGGSGHGGDTLHGLALGGPDGGEADITASGLAVVLDALDAARAELAQAKQEREMLRGAVAKSLSAFSVSTTPLPEDRAAVQEAMAMCRAALDGTKETA